MKIKCSIKYDSVSFEQNIKNKKVNILKKIILLVIGMMFLIVVTIQAKGDLPTGTPATRENLLEDAVIDLLQPQMYSAVKDHYGTIKEIGFQCLKVVEIKKLDHPGSWLFEAKLEGRTYTGAHNALDIFTVTVKKDYETNLEWVMQDYKTRKYDPNETYECRNPA